jgi:SNF2 family DNA or RNA helicase
MLIHKPSRKIVLKLKDPARITTVIPSAKTFDYRGETLVAVPHRLEEAVVLRNMGYAAPSPIEHYYGWPGKFKPFDAQVSTASFLTLNSRAFVLSEMGTGKTLSTIWAYDYLRSTGKANKLLVVAPLSTLERVWADEVFGNMPHLSVGVLHGSKDRRLKLLKDDSFDVYVINHHGVEVIEKELIAKTDIDTVIVDEIATFRNGSTNLWKSLRKVCLGRARVWGLTGTPQPNAPTDVYAQCKLIVPGNVPHFFGQFRDMVMRKKGPFAWEPRKESTEIVASIMRPSIRFVRADCLDLPDTLFTDREVGLTKEQTEAYRQMLVSLRADLANGSLMAANEATKLGKLLQICVGCAYDKNGNGVSLDVSTRVSELLDIIEQSEGKVLVFIPFTGALEQVAEKLGEHHEVAVVHGGTTKTARDQIFHEFQKGSQLRVIVANAGTLSHGLTLTAANTIIWFGPPTSSEQYQQANSRVTRPGQTKNTLVVHMVGSPVEKRIYSRLRRRQSLQGLLLNMLTDGEV